MSRADQLRALVIEQLEAIDKRLDQLGEDAMLTMASYDGGAVDFVEDAIDEIKKKTARILELVTAD